MAVDRWPPYLEQITGNGTPMVVNGLVYATPGASTITFTPSVDCMAGAVGRVEAVTTTFVAGSNLLVRMNFSPGGPSLRLGVLPPGVLNQRATMFTSNRFNLTANTAYTIFLECALDVVGSVFTINDSSFNLTVMPRLHAPLA